MTLAFHHGHGSPFSWRVFLALEHKGVAYDLHTISFDRRDTERPEFRRLNPRGKVPVIVEGDFVLYESAAIVEYLEDRFPDSPPLFPADLQQRAVVRRVIREADHYVGHPVQTLGRELFVRSAETRDAAAITAAARSLADEVGRFEEAAGGEYLCGALTAADFTLYPLVAMFARFDRKLPELQLASQIAPALGEWMRRIEALPYFRKTYPAHW